MYKTMGRSESLFPLNGQQPGHGVAGETKSQASIFHCLSDHADILNSQEYSFCLSFFVKWSDA